jgi:hypothetical protein
VEREPGELFVEIFTLHGDVMGTVIAVGDDDRPTPEDRTN